MSETQTKPEQVRLLLFVSKESAVYRFTRRQVEFAVQEMFGKGADVDLEIIDIEEQPELAEEHNIEALPTLVYGRKRLVGAPTPEALASWLGLVGPMPGRRRR
jgi:hypothetical protein